MLRKYYNILGISPQASLTEAKKAYRALAVIHHPDAGGSEAKFKEISVAYNIVTGKQQVPRHERRAAEQARYSHEDEMSKQRRNWRANWQEPRPSPRPSRPKVPYTYDHKVYEACSACDGAGQETKHCRPCYGTGNVVGRNINGFAVNYCDPCKGSGRLKSWVCETCKGLGKFHVRTEKRTGYR